MQRSVIRGFNAASAGFGINFAPVAASELYVSDAYISENGTGATGGGVRIRATGATAVNAIFSRIKVNNNSSGIRLDGTGSTAAMNLIVQASGVSGNGGNGVTSISPAGGSTLKMMVSGSLIAVNSGVGVNSNGAAASGAGSSLVQIGGSTVTANVTGVSVTGAGLLQSFKNNIIAGNVADGTPLTAFPGPGGTPLQ